MYMVKNNLSPPFIQDIFEYKGHGRINRMGDKFARPNVNKVYKGENSLRNFGPIVWNNILPQNLKECSSLLEFKNSIKSWIPNNFPCRLCKINVKGVVFFRSV